MRVATPISPSPCARRRCSRPSNRPSHSPRPRPPSLSPPPMFRRIGPRYGLVNRLMTLGLDRRWRRETVAIVRPAGAFALDIATGTGDLAVELARQGARRVMGADFCVDMLIAAVAKAAQADAAAKVVFAAGDVTRLPFHDDTFDCVVNGFMLRNVTDLPAP